MHAYVLAKSNAKFRRSSTSPKIVNKSESTIQEPTPPDLSLIKKASAEQTSSTGSSFHDGANKTYKSHAALVQIALPNQQVKKQELECCTIEINLIGVICFRKCSLINCLFFVD